MNQFEKAIQGPVTCDICGEVMHPMYGGGWDNDRLVCADPECGAEIEYPTSTEYKVDEVALGYTARYERNDHWRDHVAFGYPAPGCERNNKYLGIHALTAGLASPGNTGMGHLLLAPENPPGKGLSDCVFIGIDAGADERDAQGLVIIGDGIRSREQARSMSGLVIIGDNRVIIGRTLYGQSISNLADVIRMQVKKQKENSNEPV